MPHFDLVIIGSGSGNSLVTPELDDWRIAIVEEGVFGGTCLNVGCIPTKMFVYPADLADLASHSSRLGLTPAQLKADWPAIRDRVFGRIDPIAAGGREYRASGTPNVTLYEAHADFVEPGTLRLSTGETITTDRVVLATGSRANVPDVITQSGVPFHTSDTVMRIDELPRRLIILGGGYIASEFAHVFSAFGVHTTVVARSGLLRHIDHEVADRFTDIVRDHWHLRSGVHAAGAARSDDGEISLLLSDGSTVTGDLLLVATGRAPNSDRLDLAAAGVKVDDAGLVVVDEHQRTTADSVWALGDVCNDHQLKHVANHEARVVAHNLAHPDDLRASDHRYVPAAVFTHPQLAGVGYTEERAKAEGVPYVVVTQAYGSTAYGWAMEDTTSVCKLLASPDGLIIGAHLMGEQASTLIQPIIQAMTFGLRAHDMARGQYWIHPALTEVVENALLALPLDSNSAP